MERETRMELHDILFSTDPCTGLALGSRYVLGQIQARQLITNRCILGKVIERMVDTGCVWLILP